MRFISDRKQLLIIFRNLARLLPETSPIEDLTGILIEADEDGGVLRLAATTLEISLEYRCAAVVAEKGRIVVGGKLMAGMMPLLGGDKVSFETAPDGNVVRIESANTVYDLPYLSGNHFPEPKNAPPESMVKLGGVAALAKQTIFAARKKAQSPGDMLTNAKLDVYLGEMHMICSDSLMMAVARKKQDCGGRTSLLIPIKSLALLSSICGDDDIEAGISGNSLIFKGKDFVFNTRVMSGTYMDTNSLLSQVKPVYDAIVNSRTFWSDADCLDVVSEPGAIVQIALKNDGIRLSYQGENGSFSTTTDAVVCNATSGSGFYYSVDELRQSLRYMEGNLQIGIDNAGIMLIKSNDQCYLLTPRRPRKAAVPKKDKKSKTKKADKTVKVDKAA